MQKKLLIVLLLLCLGTHAQKMYSHGVFWGRLILSDKITPRLKCELYLQKRTQNEAPGYANIFAAPHFTSVWFWVNYNLQPNLKLSVSPFGYFESNLFNTSPEDVSPPAIKEYRWTVRLETEQKFRFMNYYNRYGLEYRWRDLQNNGNYRPNYRVRYMARLEKPIKGMLSKEKPLTFILSEEVFVQFGPAVRNNPNIFDQNRIALGVNYEVAKNVKLTVSYLNILQQRISGKAVDNAHVLWGSPQLRQPVHTV